MDIGVIIAIVVGAATLVAVVGSAFYWSGRISNQVAAQGEQIAALTAQVAAQGEQIAALTAQVAALTERVAAVESRLAAVESRVAAVESRLAMVEGEVGKLIRQAERHTDRLDTMSERTDGLTAEVASTRRELIAAISHHVHHTDGSISFRAPLPETP